jgi:hypothetical protein
MHVIFSKNYLSFKEKFAHVDNYVVFGFLIQTDSRYAFKLCIPKFQFFKILILAITH